MKLLHLADLHIGKRLNEFNLIEDQKHILKQILQITKDNAIDAVLIAGDVYDKSQPSAEAVELLDEFLTQLTSLTSAVFMISGNHDSPERLGFGSRIMEKNGLYIAGSFNGSPYKITLKDEHGQVHIHMLPFIKPALVKPFFEQTIASYDEAVRLALLGSLLDAKERNILIAHQFVVDGGKEPERSDSEILPVGGLDSIDVSAFENFDYVALGHLHRPQKMGRETVRYAGSPLKYSFSEARHEKSATIIDLGPKNEVSLEYIPLVPLRDLREIKGPLEELLRLGKLDKQGAQDYLRITLTDEDELYDAIGQLRPVFPNVMALEFENSRNKPREYSETATSLDVSAQSPLELFASFYELQNNAGLSEEQIEILEQVFTQAGGATE